MHQKLILIATFITLFIVGVSVSFKLFKAQPASTTIPSLIQTTVTPSPVTTKTIHLNASIQTLPDSSSKDLVITMSSQSSLDLSVFDLQLAISASPKTSLLSSSSPVFNSALVQTGWTFPIKKVTRQTGLTLISLSGVHAAPTSFVLTPDPVILARVPLTLSPEFVSLTMSIDPALTKFLSRVSGETIIVTGPDYPLTVDP